MPVPNEIIQEFLVETHDNLERLDLELVSLEKGDASKETLSSIFRTMHSLKGSAGFLGFQKLESLTHVAETLLSRLRDGKLKVTVQIVSTMLATMDAVREMLHSIENAGHDGNQEYSQLIDQLRALANQDPSASTAVSQTLGFDDPSFVLADQQLDETRSVRMSAPATPRAATAEATISAPQPVTATPEPPARSVPAAVTPHAETELGSSLFDASGEIAAALSSSTKAAENTIRLGMDRVDKMMNLVTELVLSRNQILQHSLVQTNPMLAAAARDLDLITSELQESVMKIRMQPIGNLWNSLPRVVRDIALECGKRVRLVMEGAETELDRSVLAAIKDPLTHLVRNAIDHGIETPDVRQAAGKPVEGCVRLRAYHESGFIHIEISDDGAGIDRERLKAKAQHSGMLGDMNPEDLSDASALSLIFLQGVSTKEVVNTLSGRGVGMDVVKRNVESIGGQVSVQSTIGVGTMFELRIPLTLAIIQALMVTSSGRRYAIPQVSMVELIRLEGDRIQTCIERIQEAKVHRYRGRLLPLVSLNRILGGSEPNGGDSINIVVLESDQGQFGLVVDHVNDTQEIVVKPLHRLLRGISCFSGATILGDGDIALILDVAGVAGGSVGLAKPSKQGVGDVAPEVAAPISESQQVVLVSGLRGERLAVPLSSVARLEEVPISQVEWSGSRPVMQYRGEILPLVDVLNLLERTSSQEATNSLPHHIVVCTDGQRKVGLVVGRILDIVTDSLPVRSSSAREHVLFTAVVNSQVTEVLDIPSLISAAETSTLRAGAKA